MCEAPPPPPPVPGTPLPCDRKLGVCRTKDIFQSTWKNVYFGSSLVSSRQFAKLMTTAAGLPLKKSRFPSGRAWLLGTSGSGGCGAAHPRSGGSRWARCSLSAGPTRGEGGGARSVGGGDGDVVPHGEHGRPARDGMGLQESTDTEDRQSPLPGSGRPAGGGLGTLRRAAEARRHSPPCC